MSANSDHFTSGSIERVTNGTGYLQLRIMLFGRPSSVYITGLRREDDLLGLLEEVITLAHGRTSARKPLS